MSLWYQRDILGPKGFPLTKEDIFGILFNAVLLISVKIRFWEVLNFECTLPLRIHEACYRGRD